MAKEKSNAAFALLIVNYHLHKILNNQYHMRLTDKEKSAITDAIATFDINAVTYLFGSRTDDTKQGGDIDLLIFSNVIDRNLKRKIKLKIYDSIGEQKIDILIAKDLSDPFVRIAKDQGARL